MGSEFRSDIQGLRAVAVSLVIVYHAGVTWLPGGYVGVDVFFVISGFLITNLLLRERAETGTIAIPAFFARRAKRLLPAALLVTAATTAVAWFVYAPLSLKQFTSSAIATTAYLSNVWFALLATDYLAESAAGNPLLHMWSLSVEEQFYIFWPLLFLFAAHRRRLRLWLVLVGVTSLAASISLTAYSQPWAFFSMPTRAWEFASGGLVALSARRLPAGASFVGLAFIFVAAAGYDRSIPYPGVAAILPVLGAVLVIAGRSSLLSAKPLQRVGDMSYSLYLWHWPVLVFLHPLGIGETVASLAVIVALSAGSYFIVENPIRQRRQTPWRAFATAGAGTAACALWLLSVRAMASFALEKPEQRLFAEAALELPRIYDDGCHASTLTVDPPECVYGNTNGQQSIVLFGDSHAAHWFPALERIAVDRSWRLVVLTKSSCPSAVYEPVNAQLGRPYSECTEWRNKAFDLIDSLAPAVVVVSNFSDYGVRHDEWELAMRALLSRVSGRTVVILRDVPNASANVPSCLSLAAWRGLPATKCAVREANLDIYGAELAAAQHLARVTVVDVTPVICGGEPCPANEGGLVKYRDEHHLTVSYVTSLASEIEAWIPK